MKDSTAVIHRLTFNSDLIKLNHVYDEILAIEWTGYKALFFMKNMDMV